MVNKRPININPLRIRLPAMALVSITHRISGILVLLLIPFLLWTLQCTLASPETFNQVKDTFSAPGCKLLLGILLAGLIFHLIAGLRHLLMDFHWGDSLTAGRVGAKSVFIIAFLLIAGMAFWLWSVQ